MRNGIMNMQQIQLVIDNHIDHRAGQRSLVRLIIEKRIRRYTHFMIEYICVVFSEPHRLLVSNEMYLVAFICECFSKFRGKNATSSEGRITNNSNPHVLILLNEVKQISQHHIRTVHYLS